MAFRPSSYLSANRNHWEHSMTICVLPLRRRLVAFVFPLIVGAIAALTIPTFIEAGLPWWPLFIFGVPGLLALQICFEYWNVTIGFDAEQLHYRSVGYQVTAPWHHLSERVIDGKVLLHVRDCEPHYHWWLWIMQAFLSMFMPARSRYAHGLMAIIPLHWFASTPDSAVMREIRSMAGGKMTSGEGREE